VKILKVKDIALLNKSSQSYGMSLTIIVGSHQCYLPPDTSEWATPNPSWYSIYLPRRNGRLSWPRRFVTYRDGLPVCHQTVTHPSTNRARCGATALIETNVLTTTPRHLW